MPRNKRKHPHSRYERFMLACINSLPFTFNSPGEPNVPGYKKYPKQNPEKHKVTTAGGVQYKGTRKRLDYMESYDDEGLSELNISKTRKQERGREN